MDTGSKPPCRAFIAEKRRRSFWRATSIRAAPNRRTSPKSPASPCCPEVRPPPLPAEFSLRACTHGDAAAMAAIYRKVFPTYPFPIHDPAWLRETMESHIDYFGVEHGGRLVALASSEMELDGLNVEMTDFATLPEFRGRNLALHLLAAMEEAMRRKGMRTAYTIARAMSPGMNITFAKAGYKFSGTLVNNTNISGGIESMNVWYKSLG